MGISNKMCKYYLVIFIEISFLALLILTSSCNEGSDTGLTSSTAILPEPTPSNTVLPNGSNPVSPLSSPASLPADPILRAQEIVKNALSAMNKVKSFSLNIDVSFSEQLINNTGEPDRPQTYNWAGNKVVNLSDKQMKMALKIDRDYSGAKNQELLQMFLMDEWEYFEITPISASSTPLSGSTWQKTKLVDETWLEETQINQQMEMLQSATEVSIIGSENVNGTDCYILEITPSAEAIADWVLSQGQPGGPGFAASFAPALVGKDVFIKTYQHNPLKEWIAKDSNLIIKVELDPQFVAAPADIAWFNPSAPNQTPGFAKLIAEFKGQFSYFDYNQPVSIQLSPEALNAPASQ